MDERTLNDLLECSVCLERLDTTSKVLPCQHTFCRKCLQDIVSSHSELRCPECRILIEIKIDDLPPNVLLMRILEGMKNATHNQIISTAIKTPVHRNIVATSNHNKTSMNLAHTIIRPNMLINKSVEDIPQHHQHQHQNSTNPKSKSNLPHAIALYDFISTEPGDLCFKKGDNILLRKRLNANWFIGEINGRDGAFPINYVQILVPLPVPLCKALYDFRMGPKDEEGCLIFKKGAIINVYRRVDNNWAEGCIGDCIGIFPIAFVEMNALAKQIMDSSATFVSYVPSFLRSTPPTPIDGGSVGGGCGDLSLNSSSSNDSSSTATSTSPNSSNSSSTSSNTTSNSSTAPNSPTNNAINVCANVINSRSKSRGLTEKRHSLTAITAANTSNILQQNNRHSAEILSVLETDFTNQPAISQIEPIAAPTHQYHTSRQSNTHSKSSLLNSHAFIPNLPASYVALYPYKPRKPDELELKKGSIYYVTERCQDGWFKGANRAQKTGVFPGNYVAPLRNNRGHDSGQLLSAAVNGKRAGNGQMISSGNNLIGGQNINNVGVNSVPILAPPELPPRNVPTSSSVWTKPLGQHVESFFCKKAFGTGQTRKEIVGKNDVQKLANNQMNHKDKKDHAQSSTSVSSSSTSSAVSLMKRLTNIKRSKSPTSCTSTNHQTTFSIDNPVFENHTSPGPAQNPLKSSLSTSASSSTPTKRSTVQLSHPVHVRSGSCPSQLLQSLPIDLNVSIITGAVNSPSEQLANSSSSYLFSSQRVKGHKERPILHSMRQSNGDHTSRHRTNMNCDNHTTVITKPTSAIMANNINNSIQPTPICSYHRKSQSLDATTISTQIVANSYGTVVGTTAKIASKFNQKTNLPKERFRCIVAYPPNSEFELELHVGDIVFVQKKRENGWYKGTHSRTGKIGLFPASFVEPDI